MTLGVPSHQEGIQGLKTANTVALFNTHLLVYILCWAKPHIHTHPHSYLADSGRYLHWQLISFLDAVHLKQMPPSGPFWVKVEVSFFALLWALWGHHPCPLSLSSSSIIRVYSSSPIPPLGFSQSHCGNRLSFLYPLDSLYPHSTTFTEALHSLFTRQVLPLQKPHWLPGSINLLAYICYYRFYLLTRGIHQLRCPVADRVSFRAPFAERIAVAIFYFCGIVPICNVELQTKVSNFTSEFLWSTPVNPILALFDVTCLSDLM